MRKCFKLRRPLKFNFYLTLLLVSLLSFNSSLYAQQKVIRGVVTDANSQPLQGVSVTIKGTTIGVSTGADGSYSISASTKDIIKFTFVGKIPQEITVRDKNLINVSLNESNVSSLNEVVVTGYMTQRKADLTGAVSVVSEKELSKSHGVTNIMQSLQGVVPGMHITTDGSPVGNAGIQLSLIHI